MPLFSSPSSTIKRARARGWGWNFHFIWICSPSSVVWFSCCCWYICTFFELIRSFLLLLNMRDVDAEFEFCIVCSVSVYVFVSQQQVSPIVVPSIFFPPLQKDMLECWWCCFSVLKKWHHREENESGGNENARDLCWLNISIGEELMGRRSTWNGNKL